MEADRLKDESAKNKEMKRMQKEQEELKKYGKTPCVYKIKYYNTILVYNHTQQPCTTVQNFIDKDNFKLSNFDKSILKRKKKFSPFVSFVFLLRSFDMFKR